MGLDMHLERAPRIAGLSVADYSKMSNAAAGGRSLEDAEQRVLATGHPLAAEAAAAVKPRGSWFTLLEEAGYWRKANQIHAWFVKNVQAGVDDCGLYEVTRAQLEELLALAQRVQKKPALAAAALPTQDGFFFGNTSYDEGYRDDIDSTVRIVEQILAETDFDKQIVFYQSSW